MKFYSNNPHTLQPESVGDTDGPVSMFLIGYHLIPNMNESTNIGYYFTERKILCYMNVEDMYNNYKSV